MKEDVKRLLANVAALPTGQEFNPVSLLVRRELDLSHLLAWLLDPHGSHGRGDIYLRSFLAVLGLPEIQDLKRTRVRREAPRFCSGDLVGNVDIQLDHPKFLLLLENKPTARFGDRQLVRYVSSLNPSSGRIERVIALLGAGYGAEEVAKISRDGASALLLGGSVRDWISASADQTSEGPVRELLIFLVKDLDERHGESGSRYSNAVIDEMVGSPDAVRAAVAMYDARRAFAVRMHDNLAILIERRAAAAGLGRIRPLPKEMKLFGSARHGVIRLDIGASDIDVMIEDDGTGFSDTAVGVVLRSPITAPGRVHADRVTRLRQALGDGAGDDLDRWYLWWDQLGSIHPDGRLPPAPADRWAWAADDSESGLAARFVAKAVDVKKILSV